MVMPTGFKLEPTRVPHRLLPTAPPIFSSVFPRQAKSPNGLYLMRQRVPPRSWSRNIQWMALRDMTASSDGEYIFAADTKSPHVHRIRYADGITEKWEIGSSAVALALSTDGSHLVVARQGVQDVLVIADATGDSPVNVAANPTLVPATNCLPDCESDQSPAEQCPNAHPADLGICKGSNGIEISESGAYPAFTSDLYLRRSQHLERAQVFRHSPCLAKASRTSHWSKSGRKWF